MNLIDLIFPENCLQCKKSGTYICNECLSKAGKATPICPVCQNASIDGFTHSKCKTKFGIDGLITIWEYSGVIRKAIIALKYRYATEVIKSLNVSIVRELKNTEVLPSKNYCLVPIPLHWYRENSRGFNQSFELGKQLALKMNWKFVPNLLTRKKFTTPQAKLPGKDRRGNVRGVFSLKTKDRLPDTNYIIFDDVYTTGSTLKEAAIVLKRNGALSVWGLTVAR